jgi:hypothetical protein
VWQVRGSAAVLTQERAAPGHGGRSSTAVLAALTLVGAILRFFRISGQSFWIDEMLTLRAANVGGSLGLREALSNIQGPLHTSLIHWLSGVSTEEWVLRLPSAMAGIALIPVVYLLGRELAGRRAGIVAASIVAVSPFSIWYSQEVRNYAFLMFFSGLSTLLAWRALSDRTGRWVVYVLSSAAAIYSNLSGVFLVIGQNIFAFGSHLARRRMPVRWILSTAVVVLLFLPLGLVGVVGWVTVDDVAERITLTPLAEQDDLLRGSTTFTPMAIPYSVFSMIYGYSLGPSTRELHLNEPLEAYLKHIWIVLPAGAAALVGLVAGIVELQRRRPALAYVASVALAAVGGTAALALLNIKPYNVRYVSVVFPVLAVTLGAGVVRLGRRGILLWGLVLLFCLVSARAYYFDPRYAREDVRGAARHVELHEKPGDVVLVPIVPHVFSFYFKGEADRFVLYRGQAKSAEGIEATVEAATEGRGRLWFVESRLWFIDPDRRLPAYLESRYALLDRREFAGVELSLFDLNERGSGSSGGTGTTSE